MVFYALYNSVNVYQNNVLNNEKSITIVLRQLSHVKAPECSFFEMVDGDLNRAVVLRYRIVTGVDKLLNEIAWLDTFQVIYNER